MVCGIIGAGAVAIILVQIMDQLLFGLVIRYLVIAVALLHASRGQRPRLRVIYGLNDVDNDNLLECIDDHNLIRSGATYRTYCNLSATLI